MRTLSLELACQPAALVSARDAVREHLMRAEIDERTRNAIDLSLDELLGNTIRHGAGERACRASLTLSRVEQRLLLVLEDDARPFDPTTHPEPERPTSLATARIGGLGISMVRKVVRSMRYSRQRGRNRLELEFELESPGSRGG
jgi:serine/threonine-protein kinase RsbW